MNWAEFCPSLTVAHVGKRSHESRLLLRALLQSKGTVGCNLGVSFQTDLYRNIHSWKPKKKNPKAHALLSLISHGGCQGHRITTLNIDWRFALQQRGKKTKNKTHVIKVSQWGVIWVHLHESNKQEMNQTAASDINQMNMFIRFPLWINNTFANICTKLNQMI